MMLKKIRRGISSLFSRDNKIESSDNWRFTEDLGLKDNSLVWLIIPGRMYHSGNSFIWPIEYKMSKYYDGTCCLKWNGMVEKCQSKSEAVIKAALEFAICIEPLDPGIFWRNPGFIPDIILDLSKYKTI